MSSMFSFVMNAFGTYKKQSLFVHSLIKIILLLHVYYDADAKYRYC